ncbi:hypothetical protein J4447_01110, partial [Candidatus Pacearchaeota archaeon]|nr:hypothetical protein [Candidatus Pacearchaeota archaeon]
MVYKKFIKRNGKTFGPYYYESYRVGNSVKKRYIGTSLPSAPLKAHPKVSSISRTLHIDNLKRGYGSYSTARPSVGHANPVSGFTKPWHVFTLIGVLLIAVIFSILFMKGAFITGHAVAELSRDSLVINLERGELLPAETRITITQGDDEQNFTISQLVSNSNPVWGSYYLENTAISGSGTGFGEPLKYYNIPEVFFEFRVIGGKHEAPERAAPIQLESPQDNQLSEENKGAPITGFITLEEPEKVVGGKVRFGEEFIYELSERQTVELIPNSARTAEGPISDSLIRYSIVENDAVFVTEHQEVREEFGASNNQTDQTEQIVTDSGGLEIVIPYNKLNLEEGPVTITLNYNGEEITRVSGIYTKPRAIGLPEEPEEETPSNIEKGPTTPSAPPIDEAVNETSYFLKQDPAYLGRPVRWVQTLNASEAGIITISLPKETISASLKKMSQGVEVGTLELVSNGQINSKIREEKELINATNPPIGSTTPTLPTNVSQPTTSTPAQPISKPPITPAPEVPSNETNATTTPITELPELLPAPAPAPTDNIPGLVENNTNNANRQDNEEIANNPSPITGFVINDNNLKRTNWLARFFSKFFSFLGLGRAGITGYAVSETSDFGSDVNDVVDVEQFQTYTTLSSQENITIEVPADGIERTYEIEYYTTPPYSVETQLDINNKEIKEVLITAPEPNGQHYTNITAFTKIAENLNISNADQLRLLDINNNRDALFEAIDKNNNNIIDMLEWNVESLSNRTYHIIINTQGLFNESGAVYSNTTTNASGHTTLYHMNESEIAMYGVSNNTGLVALYHFNNDSIYGENATRVYDFSGNGNNGSAIGGSSSGGITSITSGKILKALSFDGTISYINLSMAGNSSVNTSLGMTLMVWVNATATQNSLKAGIVAKDNLQGQGLYSLFIGSASNWAPRFHLNNSLYVDGSADLRDSQWHHVTATDNGSRIIMYVDGVLKDAVNFTGYLNQTFTAFTGSSFTVNDQTDWNLGTYVANTTANSSGQLILADSEITSGWFNTTGLALLYHFNNDSLYGESETRMYDFSGNQMNGTKVNEVVVNASGKIRGAMMFDGTNDYVEINTTQQLNFTSTGPRPNFTISVWINSNRGSGGIVRGGSMDFEVTEAGIYLDGGPSSGQRIQGTGNFSQTGWHHIVAVRQSSAPTMAIYVDGVLNVSRNDGGTVDDQIVYWRVGRAGYSDTAYFNGSIDEVAIWNRSLSAAEISRLYDAQKNNSYMQSGTYTTKVFDSEDPNNNASWGMVTTNYTAVNGGIGYQVQSCDDSACSGETFVGPTNTSSSTFTNSAVNLNTTLTPNNRYLQMKYYLNTTNNATTPYVTNVSLNFSAWVSRASELFVGSFSNVSYVFNGTIDEVGIWNRTLSANEIETIYEAQKSLYPSAGTYTSKIYTAPNASTTWNNISIQVSYAGSEGILGNEINATSGATEETNLTGLIALYHFNNESGYGENTTRVYDFSGMQNNGTATGGVVMNTTGKIRGAGTFDGGDDYIGVPYSASLAPTLVTLSYWMRENVQPDSLDMLVSRKYDGTGIPYLSDLRGTSNSQITFGTFPGADIFVTSNTVTVPNKWYHVVGTFNGSAYLIYINGVLDNTLIDSTALYGGTSLRLTIGNLDLNGVPSRFFNGSIDEVAIWNRSLNSTEILNLYNKQRNRFQFSVRNCSTSDCSGASGTWKGPYYNTNATLTLNGGQYFQYRAELYTSNRSITSIINGTDIYYTSNDVIAPNITIQSPTNTSYAKGTTRIDFNLTATEDLIGSAYLYLDSQVGNSSLGFYNAGSGLVASYHFDNDSAWGENATRIYDFSGNQNNGTAIGGVVINTSGKIRGAGWFDGTDDRVTVQDSPSFANMQGLTLSFWYYADSTYAQDIIAKYAGGSSFLIYSGNGGTGFIIYINAVSVSTATGLFNVNTRNYITLTYNQSKVLTYVNGALADTQSLSVGPVANSTGNLEIMGYPGDQFVSGSIDEVAIWNRSLSADEITALYNAQKGILMQRYNDTFANYTNGTMTEGAHRAWFYVNDTGGNENATLNETLFSIQTITCVTWNGSTTNWSVAGNWNTGAVPTSTDCVVINGGYTAAPVLSVPAAIYNLSIGRSTASVLTLGMNWNASLNITQNFYIGTYGVMNHSDNSNAQNYSINIITGNFTLESVGLINVSGLGYDTGQGPGSPNTSASTDDYMGASYGG